MIPQVCQPWSLLHGPLWTFYSLMTKGLKPDSAGSHPSYTSNIQSDWSMPIRGWSSGCWFSGMPDPTWEGVSKGPGSTSLLSTSYLQGWAAWPAGPYSCRVVTCLPHASNRSPASTSKAAEWIQIQAGWSKRTPGKRLGTMTYTIHIPAPPGLSKKQMTPRLPLLFNSLPLPEHAKPFSHLPSQLPRPR